MIMPARAMMKTIVTGMINANLWLQKKVRHRFKRALYPAGYDDSILPRRKKRVAKVTKKINRMIPEITNIL
jgi:hypothetical protein